MRTSRLHWIPGLFVAGFAVVLAANGALIWFATTTFTGLETEHAYERGLAYNQSLQEAAAVSTLNWQAQVTVRKLDGAYTILVSLSDELGSPKSGLALTGKLVRPTDARLDRELVWTEVTIGRYQTQPLNQAPAGQWELRIANSDANPGWQMSRRLYFQ